MTDLPATMKAVVFHGPKHIAVEERPVPKRKPPSRMPHISDTALTQTAVQDPKDIIVKVHSTALCGS